MFHVIGGLILAYMLAATLSDVAALDKDKGK
jgi:hypothetical protein